MKTAEEWAVGYSDPETRAAFAKRFREVQLDAMREGMRRAADMCDEIGMAQLTTSQCRPYTMARDAILAASEQLTEKDL